MALKRMKAGSGGSWGFGGCENGVVEGLLEKKSGFSMRVSQTSETHLNRVRDFGGRHERMFSITSSGTILLFGGDDLTELKAGSGGPGELVVAKMEWLRRFLEKK